MRKWKFIGILTFLMATGLAVLTMDVYAQSPSQPWICKVVSIQGQVLARRVGDKQWIPVSLNETYRAQDRIRVGPNSRAAIVLSNDAVLRIDQNTVLVLEGIEEKSTFLLNLLKGAAHFFSRKARSLKLTTPFVNGIIKGTEFFVRVDEEQTFISLFEGRVLADNSSGSLLLSKGQTAVARANQAPHVEVVVRPRDAVQWTLYYPPIFALDPDDYTITSSEAWQTRFRASVNDYQQGDLHGAFSKIDGLGDDIVDPQFFIYRAGLALAVGRVSNAQADIDRTLRLDSDNSQAWALRSIIAVVQNRKEDAIADAQQAVALNPDAPAARIALSYAHQARFELEAAHDQIREATEKAPDNAIAWARMAELRLSTGDLNGALTAAQRAAGLAPNIARTQTVLGYAYLIQINIKAAKQVFEKAIRIDSAAPLPRLGLGLAKIRGGHLKEGRSEIEIAAGLDPDNALIRSYLGKAYFDEKRSPLDADQFQMAKALDPQDPTPWFYDAIRKQAQNRPVEALQDLQKSAELNDNRAVYRSKLLLDQDLAARSASIGRIYRDLGFQQLALVQGWKSINTDPTNFSAHRFLADSYSVLPRHEVARVSELLQSQLLQPLNITPVQPQLAEADLVIMEDAGPADPAFNEFSPLFHRNRLALQASGIIGSNETYGNDLVQSGLWDRFSYSLGQFHYETNGFRDNNDRDINLYNVFTQASLSPKTSLLAEYRWRDTTEGDLPLRFDPDSFSPYFRQNRDRQSIRLGGRYTMNPKNHLIGTIVLSELEGDTHTAVPEYEVEFDEEVEQKSYFAEIQHLYRSNRLNLISGIGHFHMEDKTIETYNSVPQDELKTDVNHTNAYLYSQVHLLDTLNCSLGASIDFYESYSEDRDQFNPKFGLTWHLLPDTTLRAAVFRTLKRKLIADQTLEPTQVNGFNQFFDDNDGVDTWRYGMAVDHEFTDNLFIGLEYSKREKDVPYEDISMQIHRVRWDEYLGRAYLYWAPRNWVSTSLGYFYEKFERDSEFVGYDQIKDVTTHKYPLELNFFDPTGVTFRIKTTYVDQDGEFGDPRFFSTVQANDHFWLVDTALSYRLPKRHGIITLEVKNLFDENFRFQDTDPSNPSFKPERSILLKITLSI